MIATVAGIALGLVLIAAAAQKLADPAAARAGLAGFGLRGRWVLVVLIATEAGLGVGLALGWEPAAPLAAGLFLAFAGALLLALRRGRGGAPCGCFGARSRVSGVAAARAAGLGAACAALPLLPDEPASTDTWLALGLGLALSGVAVLAVLVLSLAREVGELRRRTAGPGALELAHEGPEVGGRSPLIERFGELEPERLALAVFVSDACPLCAALGPALAALEQEPVVALRVLDELADADAWSAADAPGSPFAVALAPDGTVLAKGTVNSGAQLESVLATAERRREAQRA